MNIIFDYNRTLFDPEKGGLHAGVYEILKKLSKRHKLFLISYNEFGREKFMKNVGIEKFFANVSLVENKNKVSMLALTDGLNLSGVTFVIGDSLRDEITIGNELGYETIWLKKSKFASETPRNEREKPKHIINELAEIFEILEKCEKE